MQSKIDQLQAQVAKLEAENAAQSLMMTSMTGELDKAGSYGMNRESVIRNLRLQVEWKQEEVEKLKEEREYFRSQAKAADQLLEMLTAAQAANAELKKDVEYWERAHKGQKDQTDILERALDAEIQRRFDGNRIASDEWREECAAYEARIAELESALELECGDRCNAEYNPCNAREALSRKSNLDALEAYRDGVIEECAENVGLLWAVNSIGEDCCKVAQKNIRALKKGQA